jgi:hypothetical protein
MVSSLLSPPSEAGRKFRPGADRWTLFSICSVLEHAKGFAIFTVVKAGFLLSARGGSGIVVAKLDDGCKPFCSFLPIAYSTELTQLQCPAWIFIAWSAPSAIGTAGIGFGSQLGAEITDFLIVCLLDPSLPLQELTPCYSFNNQVLNSRSAVTTFMSAGTSCGVLSRRVSTGSSTGGLLLTELPSLPCQARSTWGETCLSVVYEHALLPRLRY